MNEDQRLIRHIETRLMSLKMRIRDLEAENKHLKFKLDEQEKSKKLPDDLEKNNS